MGRFAEIPDVMPSPFQAAGQEVMLVSYFSGTVKSTPGYDKLRQLSSFVALQTGIKVGSRVGLTVDLFTAAGILILYMQTEACWKTTYPASERWRRRGSSNSRR